ncbi:MAG: hypothetical protein L0338_38030, partial [Acidobacteria bacterium]|nr:hypothetical protein [Acidobacteriota bacterium]
TMIAIWLLSLKTIVQSYCQLSGAILKSLGRMVVIGQIQTVHFLFLTAGLAFVFYGSPSLASLLGLLLAGQVLEWVLFGIVLGRSGVRPARVTSIECWKLIRRSTPFGIRHTCANLTLRLDVILLAAWVPLAEVGQFAAAHTLLVILYVVSWLFGTVLLPELVALVYNSPQMKAYVRRWSVTIVATCAPLAIVGFFVIAPVVRIVYGEAFAFAGSLAALMFLALPFVQLNSLYSNRAVALNRPRVYLGAQVASTVLAVALNVTLGVMLGALGVAIAVVGREVSMFAFFYLSAGTVSA